MKSKFILIAALLSLFASPTWAQLGIVGDTVYNFTLQDIEGETHELSGYRGKIILLFFLTPS